MQYIIDFNHTTEIMNCAEKYAEFCAETTIVTEIIEEKKQKYEQSKKRHILCIEAG